MTVLDERGTVRYVSPAVERVLGYTPHELVGRAATELVAPEDAARIGDLLERAVREPGFSVRLEYRQQARDGSWRTLEAVGRNLLDDPAVHGIVVNSRDVTERRQLEEALRDAERLQAVGKLAGGVAHNFNNLLTVITAHVQFVLDSLEQDDARRADIDEIGRAAAHASALTRELLAFGRQQLLQPRVLDLAALVARLEPTLGRLLGPAVQVIVVPAPEPGLVVADPDKLEQVVLNLAINARDAMPLGGVLTVETAEVDVDAAAAADQPGAAPGRYVALSVSDTGVGIDVATRRHLFEPFFTTKPRDRGTGLGLATIYGTVQQSGGFVTVSSVVGQGTTFRVHLPRATGSAAESDSRDGAAAPVRGGGATILLAEDEEAVRRVARRVLQRQGYTVLEARHGSDALRIAAAHPGAIDLLLTDAVMPEMGGQELIERLVALRPGVRTLLTSGYTDDEAIRRVLADTGAAFLGKPFTGEQLVAAVRGVLGAAVE